ncbi:hypothetical protein UC35_14955 [Ramlibacter tataouinensis]|uniref:Uncharacterized protein n=1 Tax=Ramlibacter tataouinensis TaxID=94132 RepID=A0A127JVH8_9BURK|nr:hypothetical protein UC35_14955 [Ramlibacter tataouinensis]
MLSGVAKESKQARRHFLILGKPLRMFFPYRQCAIEATTTLRVKRAATMFFEILGHEGLHLV